jgi:hypothetical protein
MTLNSSGPLSIGGCTTGQSIAKELSLPTTATHSLNCTSYRTLAGVSSGAISMSNFYGKSNASYLCITTSGACVTTCGNYKIAKWTGSGSFTVNRVGSGVGNAGSHINYVVVSGGGSGAGKSYSGSNPGTSGGGGGGGILNDCSNICSSGGVSISGRTYTVTIGAGGSATSYGSCGAGHNSSICCLISTTGGGAGQSIERSGYQNGGSGGGAQPTYSGSKGTGISGQGYAGGNGCYYGGFCCVYSPWSYLGGGGGGAGSVGGNAVYNTRGGNGGSGRFVSFTCHTYSGGGGGGTGHWRTGSTHHGQSTGGAGGGAGATDCCGAKVYNSLPGGVNVGGGGGGSGMFNGTNCTYFYGLTYGSNGGSGVVAIRWRFQ